VGQLSRRKGSKPMFDKKLKAMLSGSFHNPQALRVVLILTGLLIAALVGGAPHDFGGG